MKTVVEVIASFEKLPACISLWFSMADKITQFEFLTSHGLVGIMFMDFECNCR